MDFLRIIRRGDVENLEKKIRNGLDVNVAIKEYDEKLKIYFYTIPLCLAVAKGQVKITHSLLKYGADINAYNEAWTSPLHLSTFCGHINILKMLIAKKADINIRDSHGNTALHEATRASRIGCVIILLKNNIQIDIVNKNKRTALELANELKLKTIADLIIKYQQKQNQISSARIPNVFKVVSFSNELSIIPRELDGDGAVIVVVKLQSDNDVVDTRRSSVIQLTDENNNEENSSTKLKDKQNELGNVTNEINNRKEKLTSLLKEIKTLQESFQQEKRQLTADTVLKNVLIKEISLLKESIEVGEEEVVLKEAILVNI